MVERIDLIDACRLCNDPYLDSGSTNTILLVNGLHCEINGWTPTAALKELLLELSKCNSILDTEGLKLSAGKNRPMYYHPE